METTPGEEKKEESLVFVAQINNEYSSAKAVGAIEQGTSIGYFTGEPAERPDRYTLCIGENLHILNKGDLVYMNHSCRPNVAFRWTSCIDDLASDVHTNGALTELFPEVVTIRNISQGEDITFNYNTTEWVLTSPFDCNCKSESCVGRVLGYESLNPQQRDEIAEITAPHIRRMFVKTFENDAPLVEVVQLNREFSSARAAVNICKGEVLGCFSGIRLETPDKYTLCIGDNLHILNQGKLVFMNHSCTPNVAFQWPSCCYEPDSEAPLESRFPSVVALRDIAEGEDIAFNYNTTEWQLSSPFSCNCLSNNCLGKVLGYKFLNPQERQQIDGLAAPHIERQVGKEAMQ